ncbi:MAG: hypothetical protein FD145_926 [Candidatus Saganbacteria bacterium]|uniref:Uncharacterized protein n=1 Tax=Candidatus Saganbacteria bacterium TaxID=2575572 RepID=A0A833L0W4_UNCSA|nr:MAG: hypothetical protein FD145_926 [Candidatus Saganbacteria bacterium]
MIKVTKRFKELYIDVFIKILQIIFAALIVGQIVAGKFNFWSFFSGSIACLFCMIAASKIALTLTDEEEQ